MSSLIVHQRQLLGIAKGWALTHLPGWSDECHRDLLQRHGATMLEGRISARTLTAREIESVLADYVRRGWPRRRSHPAQDGVERPVPPRIAQLVRLWGRLGQAGKVQSPTRASLLAFCERQTQHEVLYLDALSVKECQSITEALKSWLAREPAVRWKGGEQ
jgi:hypothetical protein